MVGCVNIGEACARIVATEVEAITSAVEQAKEHASRLARAIELLAQASARGDLAAALVIPGVKETLLDTKNKLILSGIGLGFATPLDKLANRLA
jgi:hypothetical protein